MNPRQREQSTAEIAGGAETVSPTPAQIAQRALHIHGQLAKTQWWSAEKLQQHQLALLKAIASHAKERTAFYAGLNLNAINSATTLPDALAAIPITARSQLANQTSSFRASRLPPGQSPAGERRSSGTSGQVVSIASTSAVFMWQNALNLRALVWAERNFSKSIAVVRNDRHAPAPYPQGNTSDRWGAVAAFPFPTGPSFYLGTTCSLEQQWEWLVRKQPAYLMTYPSIIRAFAARAKAEGPPPWPLRGISTVGETVDDDLREASRVHLHAPIHDVYSSEEIGVMAAQCPTGLHYHTSDEVLIVEILDESGRPAAAGEMGRVVVTPLVNYATPLLRYDIGDLATAGTPCECGRGLGTIARILGRYRNIFHLRDGGTFWPSFGTKAISEVAHVRQYQFRQLDYEHLEILLALDEPLTGDQEKHAANLIQDRLPAAMQLSFRYVDEIPREKSGKYQEFISLVAQGPIRQDGKETIS